MTTHHRKPLKPSSSSTSQCHHWPLSSISKPSNKFILITMASFLFLSLLTLTLVLSLSSATHRHRHRNVPASDAVLTKIQQACKATRFPDKCQSSLSHLPDLPPNLSPLQTIDLAIGISSKGLKTAQKMVVEIRDASRNNQNRTTAATNCLDVLRNSGYRITRATQDLSRARIKSARASFSSALLYQYDCWSGLKYANDTQMVNKTMSFLDGLIGRSSNALSMIFSYDNFGNDTSRWSPPKTERDGFWERDVTPGRGGLRFNGGVPRNLQADVTVCKSGCDHKTVQEAVDLAPENLDQVGGKMYVIQIKAGVYEETVRVRLEKRNLVFLGEGMGKTVITGSLNVNQPGISTYNSATVGVLGDGFMAWGVTFANTAGPDAHQAVAFRSDSDLSVIENCEFLGNQDTLYAHGNRQLYKSCNIQGNVDFIFGNSAALFQDCNILVAPRQLSPEKGEKNAIAAHGRTDPAQSTGFVFQNCLINGTEEYMKLYYSKPKVHINYLGRPWKEYSRTIFINCTMEALITAAGWIPWDGDFGLKTLYYGEYGNTGKGSNLTQRVTWSSQIPAEHVSTYSVQNFIQGDEWMESI